MYVHTNNLIFWSFNYAFYWIQNWILILLLHCRYLKKLPCINSGFKGNEVDVIVSYCILLQRYFVFILIEVMEHYSKVHVDVFLCHLQLQPEVFCYSFFLMFSNYYLSHVLYISLLIIYWVFSLSDFFKETRPGLPFSVYNVLRNSNIFLFHTPY